MLAQRKEEMLELQNQLLSEFKSIRNASIWNNDIDNVVFSLPEKKLASFGVRSFFVKKMYDYIKAQGEIEGKKLNDNVPERWFIVSMPILAELIISLQYYHNQIIDRKYEVKTHSLIINNLLSANLLRSFIWRFIRKEFESPTSLNQDSFLRVNDVIERILGYVDVGQYVDRSWCSYRHLKFNLPDDVAFNEDIEKFLSQEVVNDIWKDFMHYNLPNRHERFTKHYIRRIYLVNASLFVLFAELIMDLLGYSGAERKNINSYATYAGISFQIMNDNTDFLPPESVAKSPDDAFADIRNDNMTLPLIYYFAFNHDKDIEYLNNLRVKSDKKLLKILVPYVQRYSRPAGASVAQRAGSFLNNDNCQFALLKDMLTISFNNKYFMQYDNIVNKHTSDAKTDVYVPSALIKV